MISSRNEKELQATLKEIKTNSGNQEVYYTICDMTKNSDIEQLFSEAIEKLGGIDILVNNVGGPVAGGFAQVTDEDWGVAFEKICLAIFAQFDWHFHI